MKAILAVCLISLTVILGLDQAFADTTINTVLGSGAPGCEVTECYSPSSAHIEVGESVTWKNIDNAAHTITSGTPDYGFDGLFDTGLLMAGGSFEYVFEDAGIYPYFCMVHPWMIGSVTVGGDVVSETPIETISDTESQITLLQNENAVLKNRISELEAEISSLKDQIVEMTSEFMNSIILANQWFRAQLLS